MTIWATAAIVIRAKRATMMISVPRRIARG
jgi:hypothetical protein